MLKEYLAKALKVLRIEAGEERLDIIFFPKQIKLTGKKLKPF